MKSGAKNKFVLRILYICYVLDMNLQCIKISIQLFYYIIQQSVTKQIHQLGKTIFMAVSLTTTKNDNRMVLITSKYPNLTETHAM